MPFPFKVSPALAAKLRQHNSLRQNTVSKSLRWIVDGRYRIAVKLEPWLAEQLQPDLFFKNSVIARDYNTLLQRIQTRHGPLPINDYDKLVVIALQEVARYVRYQRDSDVWQVGEKWQTAIETVELKTGDCEDGAILLYCLCVQLGVPEERLFLWLGDALDPNNNGRQTGHCCLAYTPDLYPFQVAMLDWCYDLDERHIKDVNGRSLYSLQGKSITCHSENKTNIYLNTWFIFNSKSSYTTIQYSVNYEA